MVRKYAILWTLSSPEIYLQTKIMFFLCLTPSFLQKVLCPTLRLPEILLTFSTSAPNTTKISIMKMSQCINWAFQAQIPRGEGGSVK